MASYDDVMTALRNADAAGDHEAATRLAAIAQGYKSTSKEVQPTNPGFNQIPGQVVRPAEYDPEKDETFADKYVRGPLEAAAQVVTGAPTALVAPIVGLANGGSIPEMDKAAGEFMQNYTYAPRGNAGQRYAAGVGEAINQLAMPIAGVHGLPSIRASEGTNAMKARFSKEVPKEASNPRSAALAELAAPEVAKPVVEAPTQRIDLSPKEQAYQTKLLYEQKLREQQLAKESAFSPESDTQRAGEAMNGLRDMDSLKTALDDFDALKKEQVDTTKAVEAQDALSKRQEALEQAVAKQSSLDRGASERARQEAASAVSEAHKALLEIKEQQRLAEESRKAQQRQQMEIDDTQHVLPDTGEVYGAQYGTGRGIGRVDENGMPIRADRSIEAQQLENPLQRNLWGDELPRETTQEATRGITKAMDITPKGELRNAQLSALKGFNQKMVKEKGKKQSGQIHPDLLTFGVNRLIDRLKNDPTATQPMRRLIGGFQGTFTPDSLKRAYNESLDPSATSRIHMMSPDTFLTLAKRLEPWERGGDESTRKRESITKGLETKDGLNDIPYLMIDKNGHVYGHEGRHRSEVLAKHLDLIPVRIETPWHKNGNGDLPFKRVTQQDGTWTSSLGEPLISKEERPFYGYSETANTTASEPASKWVPKSQRGGVLVDWGSKQKTDSLPKGNILKDIGNAMIASPEKAIELAKSAKDVSQNLVQQAINNLTKGGTYLKAKLNNPVVHFTVDRFLDADNKAKAEISANLHGDYLPKLRALSKEDRAFAYDVLNTADLSKRKITPEFMDKHGFSQPLKDFLNAHKASMESSLAKINAARAAVGKKPIAAREAYSAMNMSGDYRKVVYKTVDGEKQVVGVISANSRDGKLGGSLSKIEKGLLAKDGALEFGPLQDMTARTSRAKGTPHEAFQNVLETLGEDNPHIAEFLDTLRDVAKDDAQNYLGMQTHTMQKKGVFGMEGRKPWLTKEQNAKEFFQNQVRYIEGTTRWSHLADAAKDVNTVLRDGDVATNQKNAVSLSEGYMQNSLGLNPSEFGRGVENVFNRLFSNRYADSMGLSPSRVREGLSGVKFGVNTSLLSLNPSFLGIQLIQGPASMPAMTALLRGRGLAPKGSMLTGGLDAMARAGVVILKESVGKIEGLSAVEQGALKYAKDNHVYATDMVEHANQIDRGPAYVGTKITQGPAAIIETKTRAQVFLAFVDMMNESGLTPKEGLYEQAHRMTDMAMNNYGAMEKPPIYNALGPIGSMAYNLKSFGHNELSRWAMFAREAKTNSNYVPILTQMATTIAIAGVMGLPFYSQWESIYNTITEKLFKAGAIDEPRNLSIDVMDASEALGEKVPELGKYSLSHGLLTLLGADIAKRVGLGDVLPNNAADVAFAGGSKLASMVGTAWDAATKQTEQHTKAAALAWAPPIAQSYLKSKWYTEGDLAYTQDPNKKPRATAELNDRDKLLKKIGITGINESAQKERFFQNNTIAMTYDDMRKDSLISMAYDVRLGKDISRSIEKFIRGQGDPNALQADLQQMAMEQNIPQQQLKIIQEAASKALPKVYDLQRRVR